MDVPVRSRVQDGSFVKQICRDFNRLEVGNSRNAILSQPNGKNTIGDAGQWTYPSPRKYLFHHKGFSVHVIFMRSHF